jgi:hypothetical protein
MRELNDFLNLVSEAKKESESKIGNHTIIDLSEKIKNNPFSNLLETTKIISPVAEILTENPVSEPFPQKITPLKKPKLQRVSLDFKDTSFLDILESEIVKSKEQEKEQQVKEEIFTEFFESLSVNLKPIDSSVTDDSIVETESIGDNEILPRINLGEIVVEDNVVDEAIDNVSVAEISTQSNVAHSVEQKIVEEIKKLDLTDPSHYDKLFKTNTDHFSQPDAPKIDPTIKALTDKVKYMEDWLTKISMAGPGSGEVNLRYLDDVDRPSIYDGRYLRYNDSIKKFEFAEVNPHDIIYTTTLVTTPTYTVDNDDYYIGIDYAGPVTITLPLTPSSGRMLIIKDESSNAETNPILVLGNVDNDAGGFIIQINNGAIQLIYRNGWRIV